MTALLKIDGAGFARTHALVVSVMNLNAAPHLNAQITLLGFAAAAVSPDWLDADARTHASTILSDVLTAAEAGGFNRSDRFRELIAQAQPSEFVDALAAEIVECIGGPEKFYALLELVTTPRSWMGATQ